MILDKRVIGLLPCSRLHEIEQAQRQPAGLYRPVAAGEKYLHLERPVQYLIFRQFDNGLPARDKIKPVANDRPGDVEDDRAVAHDNGICGHLEADQTFVDDGDQDDHGCKTDQPLFVRQRKYDDNREQHENRIERNTPQ